MGNRYFEGTRVKAWSYRGRKETSIGLFYLWMIGEVMITNRKGFDRIYDLRERVVPAEFDYAATEEETIEFMSRKIIAFLGMIGETRLGT